MIYVDNIYIKNLKILTMTLMNYIFHKECDCDNRPTSTLIESTNGREIGFQI